MGFGRRTFIQATALVGLAAWERDWDRLRRGLTGRLVLPGDDVYDTVRRPYNTVYAHRRPAAVALCADESDVARCLDFAARERIPVAARSGGHSYAGYSVPEHGLVVDLSALRAIRVDHRGRAEVGAGTRMIDLYDELARAGRLLPAGSCPTVGIGGLTLGGGISVVGRRYGLTIDHLRAARVVTPGDRPRRTDDHTEPDLFWALRGGGGGNFGVVTSFTFDTAPAPDVAVFVLRFPAGAATDVLGAWQEWVLDTPDGLWSACDVGAGSPPSVTVAGSWIGPDGELDRLLDRFAAKVAPTERTVLPMDYGTAMRFFAGCLPACQPDDGSPFVASSRMLHRPVEPARVVSLLAGRRTGRVQFDTFGGAIARVRPDATAFPHRHAISSAQAYVDVVGVSEAEARRLLADLRDGIGHDTGYVNYIDPDMPDWPTAYYGRNLPRLRRVARRYDPDRVLAFPQGLA
ncbi:FAD-binding dehydrogenase [Saccharothrix sp. NRRL B-16348]|uniref:FAD-binding oxidoreductase n=1 Tax=Saccharothrix sp. NRRL B-16348 TaxID=1415542 RepID=UPI0006AF97F4|nr:FAD-binding oxidoreductase [Saccharothrix sp. NRRL B-16348]KOX27576.1 FAD-binding dehydrogenase [Saccharothrix sp. NRRL B-16348]